MPTDTTPDLDEPVYTYEEAAAKLQVHRTTLSRWVREKRIGHERRGRQVRFRKSDLAAFITHIPAKPPRGSHRT